MYSHHLSNVQLEILKTFSYNLDNADLSKLREMLVVFFSERAISYANKSWDQNEWTEEKMDELLSTKLRKTK